MTDRQTLAANVKKIIGPRPRLEARDSLGAYLRGERDHVYLAYDWIFDFPALQKMDESHLLTMLDGVQGVQLRP